MQWSADRNAGFSRANPQRLFLPVVIDPEYHYEAVNVEAQQSNPHSRLWWTKRLIALRKRHQVFGRGSLEFLQPENRKVLPGDAVCDLGRLNYLNQLDQTPSVYTRDERVTTPVLFSRHVAPSTAVIDDGPAPRGDPDMQELNVQVS